MAALLPKFLVIANDLRDRILGGELRPGDEIPSERELAAQWSVARPTAARALAELRRLGLAESHVGAGTFVREVASSAARSAGDRYRQSQATGTIYDAHERAVILAAEKIADPPDAVLAALGLAAGDCAVRRERLTLLDEQPSAWSVSWFVGDLADVAPALLTRDRIRQGTMHYVEEMTGRLVTTIQDRFAARRATTAQATLLGLPKGSPLLAGEHLVLDRDAQPLEWSESIRPAGRWTETFERVVR
jgi:DNA-binding GntR family transcriptional regulator